MWFRVAVITLLVIGIGLMRVQADVEGTDRLGNITIFGFVQAVTNKKISAAVDIDTTGVEKGTQANPTWVSGLGAADGDTAATSGHAWISCQGLTNGKTNVTATTLAGCVAERDGRIIVVPYALSGDYLYGIITTSMTSTTSTALTGMGAQGGSLRNYITWCTASNAHGTVGTDIDIQDGSGGTSIGMIPAAALYGGGHVRFDPPIRTAANTAVYAKNITSGASTRLFCGGYKAI